MEWRQVGSRGLNFGSTLGREQESSSSLGLATASRLIRIQSLSLRVVSDLWKLGEALKIDEDVGTCVGTVPTNRKNNL